MIFNVCPLRKVISRQLQVVRARPFHVDVRLAGNKRVRFMSAMLQVDC